MKKKEVISSHSTYTLPRGEWQRLVVSLCNTAGHRPSTQRPLLPNVSPRPVSLPRVVTSHMSLPTTPEAPRARWGRSCAPNCDSPGPCQSVFIKAAAASLPCLAGNLLLAPKDAPWVHRSPARCHGRGGTGGGRGTAHDSHHHHRLRDRPGNLFTIWVKSSKTVNARCLVCWE